VIVEVISICEESAMAVGYCSDENGFGWSKMWVANKLFSPENTQMDEWVPLHPSKTDVASFHQYDLSQNQKWKPSSSSSPIRDPLYLYIKPECALEFEHIIIEEAQIIQQKEPGGMRFDLWKLRAEHESASDRISRYIVHECLEDHAALNYHSEQPHYLEVREALREMQAKPRSHNKGFQLVKCLKQAQV
jgi:quinol monooxygenase YgiN